MYFCDTLLSVISKQTMVDPLSLIPSETNFKELHITRMLNTRKCYSTFIWYCNFK